MRTGSIVAAVVVAVAVATGGAVVDAYTLLAVAAAAEPAVVEVKIVVVDVKTLLGRLPAPAADKG